MTIAHDAHPTTRVARGIALYYERGDEIERTTPTSYRVPSSSGDGHYIVNFAPRMFCTCMDWPQAKKAGDCCKHVYAALIVRSKHRAACRYA